MCFYYFIYLNQVHSHLTIFGLVDHLHHCLCKILFKSLKKLNKVSLNDIPSNIIYLLYYDLMSNMKSFLDYNCFPDTYLVALIQSISLLMKTEE